ncbi:MAG: NAD-binding protein [Candidatus Kariarchaeaceae archaeon]
MNRADNMFKDQWLETLYHDKNDMKRSSGRSLNIQRIIKPINRFEGIFLLLVFIFTIIFGFIGFHQYFEQRNIDIGNDSIIYEVLRLFLFEGSFRESIPLSLNIARFIAPLLFTYTGFKTLTSIFYMRIQFMQLLFLEDHIIICGLGEKGMQLALDFINDGSRVIVIERQEEVENIELLRELGAIIIIANASDAGILSKVKVGAAKYIIATTGDDETNIEIAIHTNNHMKKQESDRIIDCYIHIENKDLYYNLSQTHAYEIGRNNPRLDLHFFNIYDNTIRILILSYKLEKIHSILNLHNPITNNSKRHDLKIVILGWNQLTEALIFQLFRQLHFPFPNTVDITLIDKNANSLVNSLNERYQIPKNIGKLSGHDNEFIQNNELQYQFLRILPPETDIVFINFNDEIHATNISLSVLEHFQKKQRHIPIFTHLKNDKGVINFLTKENLEELNFDNGPVIIPFGLISVVSNRTIIINEILDHFAKELHQSYLDEMSISSEDLSQYPALVPWSHLPVNYKNANRQLADHIAIKLRSFDLGIYRDSHSPLFSFSENQLALLCPAEHNRWMINKILDGWTFSEKRDDLKKEHPSIVPWEDLNQSEKEKDRVLVSQIPTILQKLGFHISSNFSEG